MISKACVAGPYQKKLEEIAALDGVELRVVVPPYWRTDGHREWLERRHLNGYEMSVRRALFIGHFHYHFYPALAREIADFAPDLVHVDEEPYNLATAHAVWLARRHSARAVFFSWQNLSRRYPPPFSWLERFCYRRAAAIAGTGGARDVLRAKGFEGPLAVIPQFGVDPDVFRPAPGRDRPARFTVGYLGRLVEEKGLKPFMGAMSKMPDVRSRIGGRGPMANWIRKFAAERNMIDRLDGPTPVPPTEVPNFLNSLDVLVLPSLPTPKWTEQFGRVLVEAMACQIPVVASDCGEIPGVLGDAGLLTPPGDEEALVGALEQVRDNPELAEDLGRRGRARVMENYTHRKIARATGEYYSELLGGPSDSKSGSAPF
jgi:glycosyltransferase involved in cell wall biosynthesis